VLNCALRNYTIAGLECHLLPASIIVTLKVMVGRGRAENAMLSGTVAKQDTGIHKYQAILSGKKF